jgi:hypothetical protein
LKLLPHLVLGLNCFEPLQWQQLHNVTIELNSRFTNMERQLF